MVVSIVSLIGLVASAYLLIRASRAAKAAGTPLARVAWVWSGVFAFFQLALFVYGLTGLAPTDPISIIALNLVLCLCVAVSLRRDEARRRLLALAGPEGRFPHPVVAGTVLVLVAGAFATLGVEFPSNHNIFWMYPLCLLLEWALVTAVIAGAYFLFQRRGGVPAFLVVACTVLGIAEYFVILFKSMPLQPGDISAISTAMTVAGSGYTYSIDPWCLYGMAFMALGIMCCQLAALFRPEAARRSRRALVVNIVVALLCLGGVAAHVTLIDYYNTLGIQIYTWRPLESYYRQGFIPTFISGSQTMKPPVPAGYSQDKAKKLMKEYAASYDESAGATAERAAAEQQFDEDKPTVIAIMNETFSDLSIYQNLHADYQGPQYFKSLSDCLQRGTLYVSAYGGGTANSEFEFLTGNSMANLGSGVYPYTIYDLTRTENLVQQFNDLGYDTTAMHPNHATNWNRENIYKQFGFDQFLSIDDFQGSETLRGMVTDKATYDKILGLLDSNSDPQFIFDVTMQNHSGYNTGLIPADKQLNVTIDGESSSEVNEYLSLIQQSDEALQYFIQRLRTLDRKVVVVFFGDHQPYFPSTYNDKWFTNEDDAAHAERLWQTDYVIWANYDVAGNDQTSQDKDISTNYLSATLMQLIGAPLTDYQKAHISLMEDLPAINCTGYEDKSRTWHLLTEGADDATTADAKAADEARSDLATMQYYELFRDGKDVYTKVFQSAANETDPNLAPGTTKVK